ncbi:hypothetical protein [Streptomyces sp. NPDC006510]|uniref:hypothetical protein n=1 Tax=Streptomyces sp. NPDC006510 TaxID=3155600 RepID=UPI0033A3EFB4
MSETIECQAHRRDRRWTVHVATYGVYGHGRTLKAAAENTEQGLALAGVTAEVVLIPTAPELDKLRAAREAYEAALREAVTSLARRQTSLRDMSTATREPTTWVKRLLPAQAEEPAATA